MTLEKNKQISDTCFTAWLSHEPLNANEDQKPCCNPLICVFISMVVCWRDNVNTNYIVQVTHTIKLLINVRCREIIDKLRHDFTTNNERTADRGGRVGIIGPWQVWKWIRPYIHLPTGVRMESKVAKTQYRTLSGVWLTINDSILTYVMSFEQSALVELGLLVTHQPGPQSGQVKGLRQ